VRLVDHEHVELGQQAFGLGRAREQRVIHDEHAGLPREPARAHPRALASAAAAEQGARIGVGRDRGPDAAERLRVRRGEAIEIALGILVLPGTQRIERVVLLVARRGGELERARAQVVLLALEPHARHRHAGDARDGGQVALEQLVLQATRAGRDDDAAARSRGIEQARQQVGQRFAEAGRRLGEHHAAALERRGNRARQRDLAGPLLETCPGRGECAARSELRGDAVFERFHSHSARGVFDVQNGDTSLRWIFPIMGLRPGARPYMRPSRPLAVPSARPTP
jgi:hypothetical protein